MENVADLAWEPTSVAGYEQKWLVKRDGGTYKLIRIQPGARFPLHRHPDRTEYAYVLEGVLEATIEGRTFRIAPHGFAEIPAGVEHGLYNPGPAPTIAQVGAIKDHAAS
ncbi:cupin domain-containing protein [bacterium]|nr:MAG: cupin domain-containing protein [bacterium]